MEKKSLRAFLAFMLSAFLIGTDQFTKYLSVQYLKDADDISIINNVLSLHYLENHGAAFGILKNQRVFFIILTVVFSLAIVMLYFKIPSTTKFTPLRLLTIFIFSGAIGNFIDRLLYGYVVDFIYFELIDFPVFNVADIYITVSCVILFIILMFFYSEDELDTILSKKNKSNKEGTDIES